MLQRPQPLVRMTSAPVAGDGRGNGGGGRGSDSRSRGSDGRGRGRGGGGRSSDGGGRGSDSGGRGGDGGGRALVGGVYRREEGPKTTVEGPQATRWRARRPSGWRSAEAVASISTASARANELQSSDRTRGGALVVRAPYPDLP